jgi:nitrate reductase NapA
MNRRDFLQNVGAAAALATAGCQGEPQTTPLAGVSEADLTWAKAPCRFCGTGCGVEVGIHDGRVVSVRGDEAAPVNRGLLCAKGYHLPGLLYGKDRLKRPLLRNPDGAGFKPISWDEALDLIAERFQQALDDHSPDAVAMYGSGQWTIFDGYAAVKWMKAGLRSNNIDPNARLCMASAVSGFITQFQSDEPMGCYDDFDIGDDFVLWGNNMGEMHPVLFSRILEHKRHKPSVRIIDIGTRRTPTTEFADAYIEFIPGTDLALANGILHLLVAQEKIDTAFVAENVVFRRGTEDLAEIGYGCFGEQGLSSDSAAKPAEHYTFSDQVRESSLEELREFLADYTPEKVSQLTGVPEAQIRSLAEIYGDRSRGTVSLWCMGVNQHVRGTWMNNLITDLHLLTGKISRPGSNPFSLTGQPSACGTVREVGTLANRLPADMVVTNPEHRAKAEKIWRLTPGTLPAKVGLHAVDMFRALARGDIKAMWIQVTNPMVTMPNLHRFERKAGDGRFIVVSDIYPTPTTAIADLILPSAAWVEREGMFGNSERRTQHWDQLVDPPGEAKEDAWQIIEVAKRMNLGRLFPDPETDPEWHRKLYEEYRQFTLGTGKDLASYDELRSTRGLRWPVVDGKETRYRYSVEHDRHYQKHYVAEGQGKRQGVHFYKAKGYGERAAFWLRPYQPPPEVPDTEYPFWLSTGRVLEHWHTGSLTRRIKELHQAVPRAYVELNRADALELGVTTGQQVKVVSRRGSLQLPVEIDGRGKPPRGSVFVPFFDEGKLINRLTLDAMDNISYQPDFKKCAVRIEKV